MMTLAIRIARGHRGLEAARIMYYVLICINILTCIMPLVVPFLVLKAYSLLAPTF